MQEPTSNLALSRSGESRIRLGLVADSQSELNYLKHILPAADYKLTYSCLAAEVKDLPFSEVDVWLLRIAQDSDEDSDVLDRVIQQDVPVVIDDATESFRDDDKTHNAEYYISKIEKAYSLHTMQEKKTKLARKLWVLAASAGGPEAVIEFLSALGEHEKQPNDLAFIYAQHIDDTALDNLIRALQRNTSYAVKRCQAGALISAGDIYVVSPDAEIELSESKSLSVTGDAWKGDYAPSISQVIAKVSRIYKHCSGALIFSGMGDDGANAVKLMKVMGGEVYTQSLDTCAVDAMPKNVQETGCADFVGSPKEMAAKLLATF